MKSYLITDPYYYTDKKISFEKILTEKILKNKIDIICFRDKISHNKNELAQSFIKITNQLNIQNTFINGDITLAHTLKASGVHLTSTQFSDITKAKELNLKVIISCHNENEILNAINLKVDFITYSPIFNTPNKGEPKGIKHLKDIVAKYPIPIIALGGIINKEHIDEIRPTSAYGFASIRYFI